MSYDAYVYDENGFEHGWVNHTSNTREMMKKALGQELLSLNGMSVAEVTPLFQRAIRRLENPVNAERIAKLSSKNGWGDGASTLNFFREILALCLEKPDGTFEVGC